MCSGLPRFNFSTSSRSCEHFLGAALELGQLFVEVRHSCVMPRIDRGFSARLRSRLLCSVHTALAKQKD